MTEGLDLTDNGCSNLDERPFDWWDGHQPNVGILRNEDPWGGVGGGAGGMGPCEVVHGVDTNCAMYMITHSWKCCSRRLRRAWQEQDGWQARRVRAGPVWWMTAARTRTPALRVRHAYRVFTNPRSWKPTTVKIHEEIMVTMPSSALRKRTRIGSDSAATLISSITAAIT